MLDFGLVVDLRLTSPLEKRGIEDLFLDRRMHLQGGADPRCDLALAVVRAGTLELAEHALDLSMIGFEQRDRVVAAAAVSAARAAGAATPSRRLPSARPSTRVPRARARAASRAARSRGARALPLFRTA